MRIAVVAQTPTFANDALAKVGCRGADWCVLTPVEALDVLSAGDAAIGRIDVLPSLDGVDDGLWVLGLSPPRASRSSTMPRRCSQRTTSCSRPGSFAAPACRTRGRA